MSRSAEDMRNASGSSQTARPVAASICLIAARVALLMPTSVGAELSGSGVEVPIGAQRLDDRRTEFGLQVWDGEYWGERVLPQIALLPDDRTR